MYRVYDASTGELRVHTARPSPAAAPASLRLVVRFQCPVQLVAQLVMVSAAHTG